MRRGPAVLLALGLVVLVLGWLVLSRDGSASPSDPASPAWLLVLQEPEPNMPPDPAPLDDEHHKLPDGTTMHVYVWMHQYGGRVTPGFIAQPQGQGWTQVFRVPPNPLFLPKL